MRLLERKRNGIVNVGGTIESPYRQTDIDFIEQRTFSFLLQLRLLLLGPVEILFRGQR